MGRRSPTPHPRAVPNPGPSIRSVASRASPMRPGTPRRAPTIRSIARSPDIEGLGEDDQCKQRWKYDTESPASSPRRRTPAARSSTSSPTTRSLALPRPRASSMISRSPPRSAMTRAAWSIRSSIRATVRSLRRSPKTTTTAATSSSRSGSPVRASSRLSSGASPTPMFSAIRPPRAGLTRPALRAPPIRSAAGSPAA